MAKERKLLNPKNDVGLRQAKRMARKISAKELASLTVTALSFVGAVGDLEPLVTSIRDIIIGDPDWFKFSFSVIAFIVSVSVLAVSYHIFKKDKKTFEERSKVYFYAEKKSYLDVISKIRKIHYDNVEANKLNKNYPNYLEYTDKLVTVDYVCNSNIQFSEDWYFYNPHVNEFIQSKEKFDSLVCVFSEYKYKIPNVCKPFVPFILFKEIYGEKDFYDGKKLRLSSEFDFALPKSPDKIAREALLKENEERIEGSDYKGLKRQNVLFFGETSQFNTHCTNDIAFKKIKSIERVDEEFAGHSLFIEHERVVNEENGSYVDKKIDKFIGYGETAMSNQVGCSALLITKDNKVLIRRQGADAGFYPLMLVPSGSTSVTFADYNEKDPNVRNKAHVVYLKDEDAVKNEAYKRFVENGQHILDLRATLAKCVNNDLANKFFFEPDYSKVIGFLKVVFRGNLPDFSCLAYTEMTAQEAFDMASAGWKSKKINDYKKKVHNKQKQNEFIDKINKIDTSRMFKIFDLKVDKKNNLLPDGGLLDYFTVQDKDKNKRTNDSISIQLHAILTFLNDNPNLLSDFIAEAQPYCGTAKAKRLAKEAGKKKKLCCKCKKGSKK